jgi:hypothetical protein
MHNTPHAPHRWQETSTPTSGSPFGRLLRSDDPRGSSEGFLASSLLSDVGAVSGGAREMADLGGGQVHHGALDIYAGS